MTEGQLRAVLHDGYHLLRQGRYGQAVALADRACADQPDNAHLLELASEARLANGDPQAAVDRIARAAAVAASPVPLLIKYASLLLQLRRRREARLVAGQAQALAGADGAAWWRIGALYSGCHEVAAARDAYRHAMTWLGEQPGLLYDLATMQFFGGEFDAAEVTLERLLQLAPETGDALYLRATLRRQTGQHNHLDDLRHRLTTLSDPSARAAGLYALSKELEDLGRHAESFETLTAAAACKRKTLQYDVAAECAHIAQVREAYAPDALRALQPGDAGEGAVFIVGLPRSGTTLLERLLIQRGGARSAGELMDFGALLGSATSGVLATNPGLTAAQASLQIDFAALGEEYLRGARELVHDHPVVIDKMPVNYLYCGMIATALPRARIIHLVRDPLDTCYAMYKTLFYNAYPFSYALDELADYYLAYQQTMRHWHAVLPGGILDVHYEELVRDTEHQISQVLSWCGLTSSETITGLENVPFVTASAAQVRGDVHQRSVHSSRRHLDGLMPLLKRLRAADVALPGVEVA
ncbi:sulfotransferase family protein [Xanthomonas arboricola pv. juglandis]|uniref:tetratricopeptide repeat-containing sulfotransferase family protein n=1 Tax=Xanthomonas TaxID=338 RepID=UPI000E5C4A9F|nr:MULTISPECIES: tetratricopeptide repeat-containing sulfotransferase family protein [Xanthomonas]CAD1789635.1 sulfotransferase family protein [Xanthomonas sp. CPBF 426]CAG2087115.1 sulfotransferase [Xanthomonas euroxanthea]SYZ54264.1 sulfotransferase family protein [Xanthomonas arboricola pv. juglandis]